MALGAILGAGLPVLGGLIGQGASSGARDAAMAQQQAALAAIAGVRVPTKEEMQIALEALQRQGIYAPELEAAMDLAPSRMEQIAVPPELKQAQQEQLETLRQLGKTGLSAEDRAALAQIQRETERQAQARQQSILQGMSARGMGGSGAELAAQLAASQQAAEASAARGDEVAAMAQQRALQAISSAGGLAGQMRGQEFGEQADVAQAADAISKFNLANRLAQQERNVGSRNIAQQRNLSEAQRIAEANVETRNIQEKYNKQLAEKIYDMQMRKAQAMAGGHRSMAGAYGEEADRTSQFWTGLGGGLGGLAGAAFPAKAPDELPSTQTTFRGVNNTFTMPTGNRYSLTGR